MNPFPPPREHLLSRGFPGSAATDLAGKERIFFDAYWGKQPAFLPAAFDPAVPLDRNELAALACEDAVEARLIEGSAPTFSLRHGPFADADLEHLRSDAPWTLLVNAVEHWLPELASVFETVPFLPPWAIDDLMVSFASPGGSVGPHEDRYHVFLIQLEGTRLWHLARGPAAPENQYDSGGLALLGPFTPTETHRAEPGDVLYLPPGWGHHGVAETPCLTLTLGVRTPTAAELIDSLLEQTAQGAKNDAPLPLYPTFEGLGLGDASPRAALAGALGSPLLEALLGTGASTQQRRVAQALTRPPREAPALAPERNEPAFLAALAHFGGLWPAPGRRWQLLPGDKGSLLVSDTTLLPCPLSAAERPPFSRLAPLRETDLITSAQRHFAWRCYESGLWLFPDE